MQAKYINPYTDFGFKKLFGEEANKDLLADFSKEELDEYEESLKVYRDLKGVIDTSFEEGLEQGKKQGLEQGEERGMVKVAKNALKEGLPIGIISKLTGLTKEEIEKL